MLLATFLEDVYLPSHIALSQRYGAALRESAGMFGRFLGRPARTRDFEELTISKFLASASTRRKPASVNSYRRRLLSLWSWAADNGYATREPRRRRVGTLPEELDPPEAWTESQVADLMARAAEEPGTVGEVSAADWWLSLFDSIYWTSNRISAMLAVPSPHYDGEGINFDEVVNSGKILLATGTPDPQDFLKFVRMGL